MGTGAPLPLDPITMYRVRAQIQEVFPQISERFEVTSPPTGEYNCIAWAAEDTERWWWPTNPDRYWPETVERRELLDAFIGAFATLGYIPCVHGELEPETQKVVIYCVDNVPAHMARQLGSGRWTSKLGQSWDICHHEIDGLNGGVYGLPTVFLARRRPHSFQFSTRL